MIRRSEQGTVTAELAVVLPAVLLIIAACLGGVRVIARQSGAVVAAASLARSLARGDDPAYAQSLLAGFDPQASFVREEEGDLVCVSVSVTVGLVPAGPGIPVRGHSCALAG